MTTYSKQRSNLLIENIPKPCWFFFWMRQLYIQWVDFNWRKRSRVNRPPGSFSEIWNHFVSSPFTEVLIASIYFFSGICQFAISCCKRFVPRNQKRHFCRLSLPFSCEKKNSSHFRVRMCARCTHLMTHKRNHIATSGLRSLCVGQYDTELW